MTKTSSVKLAEAEDDVYKCRSDLKESENCSFLTTTSKEDTRSQSGCHIWQETIQQEKKGCSEIPAII
ncbi:hypothetical protein JHK86_017806 [Glycine max]|nr:hypothetical protein JHK86_017806 [Glycine max]